MGALASGTVLASAARTATTVSRDIEHGAEAMGTGLAIFVDYTVTPNNAETVIASLEAKDPGSGKYVSLGNFATQTASTLGAAPTTATFCYITRPAAAKTITAANVEVNSLLLPATCRVRMTHSSTGSWVYTVAYSFVL